MMSGMIGGIFWLTASAATAALQETPTAAEAPAAKITLPEVHIAPPVGYDTAEAFKTWMEAEFQRLMAEAEKAEPAIVRADHLLQAANHMLAYGLVDDATSVALGIRAGAAHSDLHDRAKKLLADAESALAGAPPDDVASARLRMRHRTLQAFALALGAALTPQGDAEETRRAAASALAPLSEDPDEGVAAAAGLWQSLLRARESDLAPAISILPMATADLKAGREVYEFFGKLLRCRLLARESPGAALTLLLQIEEQCHKWFADASERALAIRAAAWVRGSILRDWCDKLQEPDMLKWCGESANDLTTEHFSGGKQVLPLAPVIPMLKSAPAADEGAAEDAGKEDAGEEDPQDK